ncbi:MAG: restriction endonuclease subunit S [Thermodesulfovibrionales bacterium]|jgi:type I restriction enzyme S subunit
MLTGWLKRPFDEVILDVSGGNTKTPQSEFLPHGRFPVVDQGKELIAGYVNDESRLCHVQLPVLVFGDHTRCFKYVNFPFCIGADGVKVLRPKFDVNVKYLYHYFRQVRLTEAGYDRHFKYLKRTAVVLPPFPEQKRIAEVLDKAEELRAKRRAALSQLDTLTQAIFIEMFGDPATNPKSWPLRSIGDIGKVITGNTPPRSRPDYYGSAIEWIKSDNINTPHYYLTKAEEGLSETGKAVARTAPAGAILVTCIAGSPGCIGNAAMTDREVAFNQQINALVSEQGDTLFLYVQILVGKRLIQEASTAGMKGMVSKSRFESIPLIFPPLLIQNEFAHRAAAVEKLKAAHRASLAELDALFASLQHRAFRGEL